MITASNLVISAGNWPYIDWPLRHTTARVALDDDGLKSCHFGRELASQSTGLSVPHYRPELLLMMTASNLVISAANWPHRDWPLRHTTARVALDDDGLKSCHFGRELASQRLAFSPHYSQSCSWWWRPQILSFRTGIGLTKYCFQFQTKARVALDDDGLKSCHFGRELASQRLAFTSYYSQSCSWWWRPQILSFRPRIGLTETGLYAILQPELLLMMTASNLVISAANWPHRDWPLVHTTARVALDDDGLKSCHFGRELASQSTAFSSRLRPELLLMMTASNLVISAANWPHRDWPLRHTTARVALDDDGLKSCHFGRELASQSTAFSSRLRPDLLLMMTASNLVISAANWPHRDWPLVHTTARVALDDDGLKSCHFGRELASQRLAFTPYYSQSLLLMMTASNLVISAANWPHRDWPLRPYYSQSCSWWWRPQILSFRPGIGLTKYCFQFQTKARFALDDEGLKSCHFGRELASQSTAFSSRLRPELLLMMKASNLVISAANWPHKVLLSVPD